MFSGWLSLPKCLKKEQRIEEMYKEKKKVVKDLIREHSRQETLHLLAYT
jgi:hypothetical protein